MGIHDGLPMAESAGNMGQIETELQELNHNFLDFSADDMYNDLNVDLSALPEFAPTYDFTANFDEPLAYPAGTFDTHNLFETNNTSIENFPTPDLDNKLLGFGGPVYATPVVDSNGQTWPRITAELNGMFSVAENVFEGDAAGRPLELTCYRRNLFQIAGSITLSRSIDRILSEMGQQANITELMIELTATESIEGKKADIISVPWKTGNDHGNGNHARPNSAAAGTDEKTGMAPLPITLDLQSNQEGDPLVATIPIAWKRLQFKNATANNGKRKGLQQHYLVHISLLARTELDNELVKIAEIQSNPIVVRGRSPKNFDSSNEVPLSERKLADPAHRNRSMGSVAPGAACATPHSSQWMDPAMAHNHNSRQQTRPLGNTATDMSPWSQVPAPLPSPSIDRPPKRSNTTVSPSSQRRNRPPLPLTPWDIPEIKEEKIVRPPLPLSFSIGSEEDIGSSITDPPPVERKHGRPSITSPNEALEQLYEYFPLSLDDWMPPVDAIYRPHVVHHIKLPAEVKAQPVRAKPKRYFSADD